MHFNVSAFLYTAGCCLISIFISGRSWNKGNNEWFVNLNQPKNLYIVKTWIRSAVGVSFYLLFGFILYHLIVSSEIISIIIVIFIIQLMGLSPYLLFKTKNLRLFFLTMLIFPVLAPVLIFMLLQINLTLAILTIIYFLWLAYDMSYFYRLMKLNNPS
jgi:tryptophan-rich sensory protein